MSLKNIAFIALSLIIASLAFGMTNVLKPKAKLTKGSYFEDSGLFDMEKGKTCRMDSAQGILVKIDQDHENPLFQSKLPNQVHLILWFKNGITAKRYELPNPDIDVCYWEKGDLLMFHTFKAKGWIQFDNFESGAKLLGSMDMKLIEPHHNMSNSDYHYMGGDFQLKASKRE